MNRWNRSFLTLQIGQISGGWSRAQRYPHTVQRQTGKDRDGNGPVETVGTVLFSLRSDLEGLRSGTGGACFFPPAISSFT